MEKDIVKLMHELMPTFSKSQKKIAYTIFNDFAGVAYITAAKLGALAGVSESTVVRFAIELGFKGYPEFQRALQKSITTKIKAYERIEAAELHGAHGRDILHSVMTSDMEKIKVTLESINPDDFDAVVSSLMSAKSIYIIGSQSSASLASFLNFNLALIFPNVRLIQPTSTHEIFEQMLDITSEDVLFCITYPRYSTKILGAANYANAEGATVISLTDSSEAPIVQYSSHVLLAQSDVAAFADSLTAPLSVLNALIVSIVVKSDRQAIQARLDKLENIWDQYNVFTKQ